MKKEIIVTTDGSHSIAIPDMGVTYHSTHGAIQESAHVFIKSGLGYTTIKNQSPDIVSILEMGFGTGLNALLTLLEAGSQQLRVCYETVELYPLQSGTFQLLNYCEQLNRLDLKPLFTQMHTCDWDTVIEITPFFSFKKNNCSLLDYTAAKLFNIIYFDAFAPDIQPELWTSQVFKKLYDGLLPGGVLTTYCSKSLVRKAMSEAGFIVEKIPGPPHKREIVRAIKANNA
ncbi:MAG: tRNA (5-methylaminomethyl-2-thiouridine)(34)-methyltransferase MnmD [Chitinophagaceae bacterium]